MTQPSRTQKFFLRTVNGLMPTCYAGLATIALHQLWPRMGVFPAVLTFVILWAGIYSAGMWASIERPAELRKKFPITSKELREKQKAFYDWLASRGKPVRRDRGRGRF